MSGICVNEKLQFYLKPICFNTKKDNKKMKPKIISKVSLVAFLLLSLAASLANAQSEPVYSRGDWVVGLNATRVLTDEDLRSASAGSAPRSKFQPVY